MSSAEVAVKVFRLLEAEDLRVLQVIETAMSKHEFVPKEQVAKFTKLDLARDADFHVDHLSKLGLIYQMKGPYTGFTLNYAGYDCLAINALVKGGTLEAFGKPLGVGKESDVFDALGSKGRRVAVKFHRLGRISFRQTLRKRGYTTLHSASWLYQSRLAAEKEFQALSLLFAQNVAVPEPISQNRHVVVMGIIDGSELANWKRLANPEKILREILRNVRRAYLKASIIHSDLSEYNIILKPNKHILIIDWPQFTRRDHPNSEELLTRDVQNILVYFRRKHRLYASLDKSMDYVMGKTRNLIL